MSSPLTKSKQELKLFTSLSSPQPSATQISNNESSEQQRGTSKWGLFFAATHNLSLPIERLLLKTLNAELGAPGCIADPYALAFRCSLLPAWRYKLTLKILASSYRKAVESDVVGVPGLLNYFSARTRWIDGHIKSAVQSADGFQQVLILGGGFDTRSLRLGATFPSLQYFEVDTAEILARKKALINELPEELTPKNKNQITFVPIDWTNPSALIPALTAAGFQPTLKKTIVVMEGLLPHLDALQSNTILADTAALCAPGSKILFDFLHLDAFNGSNKLFTGYSTLALALANKGAPFKSGHATGFSDWVRATQRIHLRIAEVISPQNIALHLVKPEYEAAAAAAAASQGNGSTAAPIEIILPQFYSFVSAVKIIPRISLKDAAPPLQSSSLNTSGSVVRRAISSLGSASSPVTSCFYTSLISMIWGHDTDDEIEQLALRPPPPPPPLAASASSLERYQSSDWSLVASRGGGAEQEGALLQAAAPSLTPDAPSSLDHAISIPALQKYDANGEAIINENNGSGGGGSWWTSWLTRN
jgi:methyltransferase (TIGR00027 family)